MKISEIYKEKKIVFSCEVFPPKPGTDIEVIYRTISDLKELSPDFISVTYGAGGGTKQRTLEISSRIKNDFNLESLMHLTCVHARREDIKKILKEIKEKDIENILSLRGDMRSVKKNDNSLSFFSEANPDGDGEEEIIEIRNAGELVDFIRKHNDFCIGVAGYPEVHPESENIEDDIKNLKKKVDIGADFIITQLFFENEYFYRFMDKIRAQGITVPVSAGIMPVFKGKLIKKLVTLCGATIGGKLQSLIDKYGGTSDMEKAGIDYASGQIVKLFKYGVDGIHIYTMNNARLAKEIARNINLR